MSIEKDLARIADALEMIAERLQPQKLDINVTKAEASVESTAPSQSASVVTPNAQLTVQDLNAALVEQFQRLKGREKIDEVMQSEPFGVTSINDLPAEKYQALIDAVRAVA